MGYGRLWKAGAMTQWARDREVYGFRVQILPQRTYHRGISLSKIFGSTCFGQRSLSSPGVDKSSTSFGSGYGGNVASVGRRCDPQVLKRPSDHESDVAHECKALNTL